MTNPISHIHKPEVIEEIAKLTVLLVEDNEIDRMLISRMLKKNGKINSFVACGSLSDARKALGQNHFDFIISDFYLPDGEGLDFIKEIRLPSILMTASNDDLLIAQSKTIGVSEFVVKDFQGDYIEHLRISIDKVDKSLSDTETIHNIQSELEAIVDSASDLIQSADMEGRFLFTNKQWHETLGYEKGQLGALRLFDIIHPESHIHCQGLIQSIATRRSFIKEPVTLVSASGDKIYTEANITVRENKKGQPIATQAIFRNLNSQLSMKKKLMDGENRYRMLVESAVDTIFQMDERGRTQFVNNVGEKLTGYSIAELKNMHYLDLVYEEDQDKVDKFYTNQFVHLIEFTYLEFRITRKNGEIKWVGQNITLFLDEDEPSSITGFLGVVRDINKSKITERELVAYRNSLEEKVAERTHEIENIKDDICSPC